MCLFETVELCDPTQTYICLRLFMILIVLQILLQTDVYCISVTNISRANVTIRKLSKLPRKSCLMVIFISELEIVIY